MFRDFWNGWYFARNLFVVAHRKELDDIAKSLSWGGRYVVRNRFNRQRQDVEFYNTKGEVVARVRVGAYGDFMAPTNVIVTSNLSNKSKEMFECLMPGCVTHVEFAC